MRRETVLRVLGPVDDQVVAEVVATGASEEELRTASAWLANDEALLGERGAFPAGRAAELVAVLEETLQPPEADA